MILRFLRTTVNNGHHTCHTLEELLALETDVINRVQSNIIFLQ